MTQEEKRKKDAEYQREWRLKHPEWRKNWNAWRREWRKKNPEKNYLKVARYRAKENNLEFNIELKDIIIPKLCPILEIPLFYTPGKKTINTPSLDRIDNSKGYIKGNVRVISDKANSHKADLSIKQVERLLLYMKGQL